MVSEWDTRRVTLTRQFFLAAIAQCAVILLLFGLLRLVLPAPQPIQGIRFPLAFFVSTPLLVAGSYYLHRAVQFVRLERQPPFRRSLITAQISAVLFVAVQSYALWAFARASLDAENTRNHAYDYIFLAIAVHVGHFVIAQSILLWVVICALQDRYDHEYYWGVRFAGWCWHFLGGAWLFILYATLMATSSVRLLQPSHLQVVPVDGRASAAVHDSIQ